MGILTAQSCVYELNEPTDVTDDAGDNRDASDTIEAGLSSEETWLLNDERRLNLPTSQSSALAMLTAGARTGEGVERGVGR